MTELRFDGRVAIVTGAGGQEPSLGRSHAKLLAQRGAKVVVNDLGVGPDGRNVLRANAEQVADEICAAGGEAVADLHSVADEDGARRVVQTALDVWGRVDILVNNAGVCFMAHFDEISDADLRNVIDVHLMGTVWMCRAAWPHMRDAGYGRMRHFNNPSAFTRLMEDHFPTGLVSPAVAFLVHESCPVSGANLEAGGGNVGIRVFGQTTGIYDADLTIEKVRDNFAAITDTSTARLMPDLPDSGELAPGEAISAPIEVLPKRYQPS
ncbi:SDR family NAD(P)-dependent oxidoreductase [Mycobacterium intracellulare]|uniref:SDR family NAD(P)-dependent oxidoreductase n=1 Tax=Mycobacterium intracellulare TaxID=1767 RepID=UPI001EED1245|nr:SDR family NAD(P)-dependent oxidoreductase [Mycobacterium intracellulare]MEE3754314.1 SDR family NAD(P)-dependent oxidoreductase [Mycobacterium intracellulare]